MGIKCYAWWHILIVSICLTITLSINALGQTAELRALCEKYVIDCPITVGQSSSWDDIVIVQQLLRDYLKGKNKKIRDISFDGSKVIVIATISVAPLDHRSDKDIKREFSGQISSLLQNSFIQGKTIEVNSIIDRSGGRDEIQHQMVGINNKELKDKYIKNDYLVDFDAVWAAITNAIGQVNGFEIDAKSEVRRPNYGNISTLPVISQQDGFVNKYFLTVEMKQSPWGIPGANVQIETLLKVWRRRASNNNWTEINVGDSVGASLGAVYGTRSSMPVLNKIKEALQK
jgi:hypothetical protein